MTHPVWVKLASTNEHFEWENSRKQWPHFFYDLMGLMGCHGNSPGLVNIQKAVEHGHRNSEFSLWKMVDFSSSLCKRLPDMWNWEEFASWKGVFFGSNPPSDLEFVAIQFLENLGMPRSKGSSTSPWSNDLPIGWLWMVMILDITITLTWTVVNWAATKTPIFF